MAVSPGALSRAIAAPSPGQITITAAPGKTSGSTLTGTTVSTSGAAVKVVTTTTSGSTAFNAFTNFTIGSGVSVNLVLPSGTKNLVNLVANPVDIYGTVYSSLLNTANKSVVGGHVFFVAPGGFIVGSTGSIDVGALTVETASVGMTDGAGNFDPTLGGGLSGVLAGTVALNGTGGIDIAGAINASGVNDPSGDGSVRLLSNQSVTIETTGRINAGGATPLQAFQAIVALDPTVASATGVVDADGGDVILTGGSVSVSGQVAATGAGADGGGAVTVTSSAPLEDPSGSLIDVSAAGKGSAGTIGVTAPGITLDSGATLRADAEGAGSAGAGGQITLTSQATAAAPSPVSIAGLISAQALGSGAGGQITIDSTGVMTGGGGLAVNSSRQAAFTGGDAKVSGTITADAVGGGQAGYVDINATTFELPSGGLISAQGAAPSGSQSAGVDIELAATSSVDLGYAVADVSATVAGTLQGQGVVINAQANSQAQVDQIPDSSQISAVASLGGALTALLNLLGYAYVRGDGASDIEIQSGAKLNSAGAITLSATTTATAQYPYGSLSGSVGGTVLGLGVTYAEINATADVNVAANATLAAGGALSIQATNNGTVEAEALTVAQNGVAADAAAVSVANVHALVSVASGATITANSVSAVAYNNDSFETETNSYALAGAPVGIVVSVQETNTSAIATVQASLGTAADPVAGGVNVQALDETSENAVFAETTVEPTPSVLDEINIASDVGPSSGSVSGQLESGAAAAGPFVAAIARIATLGSAVSTSSPAVLAGALALASDTNAAEATLGGGQTAPATVNAAGGDVIVASLVSDPIQNIAEAGAASQYNPGRGSSASTLTLSAAVAYGSYDHTSLAVIAPDTTVEADHIGVSAQTLQPISDDLEKQFAGQFMNSGEYSSASGFDENGPNISTVLSYLNPQAGIDNNILTSYAQASTSSPSSASSSGSTGSGNVEIAGQVDLFGVTNTTEALVGSGARLISQTTDAAPSAAHPDAAQWTFALADGSTTLTFGEGVSVTAYVDSSSIDASGNLTLQTLGQDAENATEKLTSDGSTALGAAYDGANIANTTIALVDDYAQIVAPSGLQVNAVSSDQIIAIAPSSGQGSGIGGSGLFAYVTLDDTTHATISDKAGVSAPNIDLEATQDLADVVVAADYSSAGMDAVGAGVGGANAHADTEAVIGSAAADDASLASTMASFVSATQLPGLDYQAPTAPATVAQALGPLAGLVLATPAANGAAAPGGVTLPASATFDVDTLYDAATDTGYVAVAGIAGAHAGTASAPSSPIPSAATLSLNGALPVGVSPSAAISQASSGQNAGATSGAASAASASGASSSASTSPPPVDVSGAGSAAFNLESLDATAEVTGPSASSHITLSPYSAGSVVTDILSIDNPVLVALAGAGALTNPSVNTSGATAEKPPTSVAIAGAVTAQLPDDVAVAELADVTIPKSKSTSVEALVGGVEVSGALSGALATGGPGGAAAVSLSVLIDTDQADATVSSATITGTGTGGSPVSVVGYEDTDLGVGGVGLAAGMSGSVGLAVDYVSLANPSGGDAVEAQVVGSTLTGLSNPTGGAQPAALVYAGDASLLVTAAGVASDSGNAGAGAGVWLALGRTSQATLTSTTITTAGSGSTISVESNGLDQGSLDSLITTPDPSDGFGFSNPVPSSVTSGLDQSGATVATGSGALVVAAAGGLAAGDSNSVGVSFAGIDLTQSHQVTVTGSRLTANGGQIDLTASDNVLAVAAAVGAASGSSFAGAGSVTLLENSDSTGVTLTGSNTLSAATVLIGATDASTLGSLAGGFDASSGGAGVGLGVAVLTDSGSAVAQATGATIVATSTVTLSAAATGLVVDLGAALSAADGLSGAGGATANTVDESVRAIADDLTMTNDSQAVMTVSADSAQTIYTAALAVSAATGAAGVGVTVDILDGQTNASDLLNGAGADDRAYATVDAGSYDVKDLTVSAVGKASVNVIAAGVAGSDDGFGAAGSVVTNIDRGGVVAVIGGGAQVQANDNVAVLATSVDTINVVAGGIGLSGGAFGLGVSVTTNVIDGSTQAAIDNAGVVAGSASGADTVTANIGETPVDLSKFSETALVSQALTGGPSAQTASFTGVVVDASSIEQPFVAALSVGVSDGVSGAVNVVTNVIGGATSAQVLGGASVGGATSTVSVLAFDTAFSQDFAGSVALGSNVGVAAAANTVAFDRSTTADDVPGNSLQNVKALDVTATSSQEAIGLTVGAGVGEVGGAASVTIANFAADTNAWISSTNGGGSVDAQTLDIAATDTVGDNLNTGAVSVGSLAAAGGLNITNSANATYAGLGASSPSVAGTTPKNSGYDLNVEAGVVSVTADTTANWHMHVLGGALATTGAVALMGDLLLTSNDTNALVYDSSILGLSGASATSLTISAENTSSADMITGGLAIGAASTGLGVGVGVIEDDDSTVADADLDNVQAATMSITAVASRDDTQYVATAGGGEDLGIGAAVGLILVGPGAAGGEASQVAGDAETAFSGDGAGESGGGASGLSGAASGLSSTEQSLANKASVFSLPALTAPPAVDAEAIGKSNLQVTSLTVMATASTSTVQYDGALGVGAVGVGGGVGYTAVADQVTAMIGDGVDVFAQTVQVGATAEDGAAGPTGQIDAFVGGAGLVGLGAAVAIVGDDQTVTAQVAGKIDNSAATGGVLGVSAVDSSSADTQTFTLTAGAVAAGAVVSQIAKDGATTAEISGARESDVSAYGFGAVTVAASESGALDALGLAAAGGVAAALEGAAVTVEDGDQVLADVAGYSVTAPSGAYSVTVSATRSPSLTAQALGGTLSGGVAAAGSYATTSLDGSDEAEIAAGTRFSDDAALTVAALVDPGSNAANAVAAAAGGFVGANAAVAQASTSASVQALVGSGVEVGADASLKLTAERDADTQASATGVAVSGGLAVGAAVAQADSSGVIQAQVGAGLGSSDSGATAITLASLTIEAGTDLSQIGSGAVPVGDTVQASTISGSGAPIAGTAGVATTSQTAQVSAGLAGAATPGLAIVIGANPVIEAVWGMDAVGSSDTLQAALLGGSGAVVTRTQAASVSAAVGEGVTLETLGNLTLAAIAMDEDSGSTETGAGGLVNGNAGVDTTTIVTTASLDVGLGANLLVLGDPIPASTSGPGVLTLLAEQVVQANVTGTMTTGGGIEGPYVDVTINATPTNTITVEDGAGLYSVGPLSVGDYVNGAITTNVDVSTYGGVGAAGGSAIATLSPTDAVRIGQGVSIDAYGDIVISAGEAWTGAGLDFDATTLGATANANVYNYTALPVSTTNHAAATTDNTSTIVIGSSTQTGAPVTPPSGPTWTNGSAGGQTDIEGVQNVSVIAYDASGSAQASGEGHNPYLSILGLTTYDSNPQSSSSSSIAFTGVANAGVLANQQITIDPGTTADPNGVVVLGGALGPTVAAQPNNLFVLGQAALAAPAQAGALGTAVLLGPFNIYTALGNQIAATTDPTTLAALESLQAGYSATAAGNPTAMVADLFAGTGNVTFQAQSFTGFANTHLSAQGSVTVGVDDARADAAGDVLITDTIYVPTDSQSTSGAVLFLGGAAPTSATLSTSATGAPAPNLVLVQSSGQGLGVAPLVDVLGPITNPQGEVSLLNATGSIDQQASLDALTLEVQSPNGTFFSTPTGAYDALGSDPIALWSSFEILSPSVTSNPTLLAAYAANALFGGAAQAAAGSNYSETYLNWFLLSDNPAGTPYSLQSGAAKTYGLGQSSCNGVSCNQPFILFTNGLIETFGNLNPNTTYSADQSNTVSFLSSVFQFYDVPLETTSKSDASSALGATAQTALTTSSIAARQVYISSKVIIVDGAIQAGGLNVDESISNTLQTGYSSTAYADTLTDYIQNVLMSSSYAGPQLASIQPFVQVPAGTQYVPIYYDVKNEEFVVGAVSASKPGVVVLDGAIANTSAISGSISVNNGFGAYTITDQYIESYTTNENAGIPGAPVDNVTVNIALPLVLNALEAGGAAQTAMVEITDTNKTVSGPNGAEPLTTWYVQQPGSAPQQFDDANEIAAGQSVITLAGAEVTPGSTSSASYAYDPEAGLRLQWTQSYSIQRSIADNTYNGESNYVESVTNWTDATPFASPNGMSGPNTGSPVLVTNTNAVGTGGTATNAEPACTAFFCTSLSATNVTLASDFASVTCGCRGLPTVPYNLAAELVTGLTLTETSSLKADNPITITFNSFAPSITVVGDNSITIQGPVSAPTGSVNLSIQAPNVTQGVITQAVTSGIFITDTGSITAKTLSLQGGNLGTLALPLRVTLTGGGTLSAQSTLGTDIAVTGAAALGTISSTEGDVAISATQGITEAGAGISAGDITLNGGVGGVGTSAAPILIEPTIAYDTSDPLGPVGRLSVTAAGSIYVQKPTGDIYLETAASTSGSVSIQAVLGNIYAYDPTGSQTVNAQTVTALSQLWSNLDLQNPVQASQQTIGPLQNLVQSDYQQYWFIVDNATTTGSGASRSVTALDGAQTLQFANSALASNALTSSQYALLSQVVADATIQSGAQISLSTTQAALFAGQAATALGVANPTAAQITGWVQSQYTPIYASVLKSVNSQLAAIDSYVQSQFGAAGPTGFAQPAQAASALDAQYQAILAGATIGSGGQVSLTTAQETKFAAAYTAASGVANPTTAAVTAWVQSQYTLLSAEQAEYAAITNAKYASISAGAVTLTSAGLTYFAAQYTAQTGVQNPSASVITTWVQNQYAFYAQQSQSTVTAPNAGFFAAYDPNWTFELTPTWSPTLYGALTLGGGAWTQTQLGLALNSQAVLGASNITVIQDPINVSGQNVSLQAAEGQIGSSSSLTISLANPSALTAYQEAVLAAAAPGDLDITTNSSGVPTSVVVTLPQFVTVAASGTLTAVASGDIYLDGPGSVALANIDARDGVARLQFGGSITSAASGKALNGATTSPVAVQAGELIIDSAEGSIGSAATPLPIDLYNYGGGGDQPALDLAAAGGSLYLSSATVSLTVVNAYAGQTLSLSAPSDIISGITPAPDGSHIEANTVILTTTTSRGTVGYEEPAGGGSPAVYEPLVVQTGGGGLIANTAYLYVVSPATLTIAGSTVADVVSLGAAPYQASLTAPVTLAPDVGVTFIGDLNSGSATVTVDATGPVSFAGAVGGGAAGMITGTTGSVTIVAPSIALGQGAEIALSAGPISLTTAQTVSNGFGTSGASAGPGDIVLGAGALLLAPTITAVSDQNITLGAGSAVTTTTGPMTLAAAQALNLGAGVDLTSGATTPGAPNVTMTLTAGAGLTLGASDELVSTGNMSLVGTGALTLGGGDDLSSSTVLSLNGAAIGLGAQDALSGVTGLAVSTTGQLTTGADVSLTASAGPVSVSAARATLGYGLVADAPGGSVSLVFKPRGALFAGGEQVTGKSVTVQSGGGQLALGPDAAFTSTAQPLSITGGQIVLGKDDTLTASPGLTVAAVGSVASSTGDALTATAGPVSVSGAVVDLGPSTSATSGAALAVTTSGRLQVGANDTLSGAAVTLGGAGAITVGASTSITASATLTLTSRGAAVFGAGDTLHAATTVTGSAGDLTFGDDDSLSGAVVTLTSAEGMVLDSITASSSLTLQALGGPVVGDGDASAALVAPTIAITADGDIGSSLIAPLTVQATAINLLAKPFDATVWLDTIGKVTSSTIKAKGGVFVNGAKVASN